MVQLGYLRGVFLGTTLIPEFLHLLPETLALVAEIDAFKDAWRSHGVIDPRRRSALLRVSTIESVGASARLEGAKLADTEVERILDARETGTCQSRAEAEAAGYAKVIETIVANFGAIDFTEENIMLLHHHLLSYSGEDQGHRGTYRSLSSRVKAFDAEGREIGIIFETSTHFDTPRRMRELIDWTRTALAEHSPHPLIAIAAFTAVFLDIRPFQSGNGPLSRALTTLLLLRGGYHYVVYSSLESVLESRREGYDLAFRQTQATIRREEPNWQPWLLYFLRTLQEQIRRLERRLKRERLARAWLPALSLQIADLVEDRGRLTIGDIVKLTGANHNTVKRHMSQLVASNHLTRRGGGNSTWYAIALHPEAH